MTIAQFLNALVKRWKFIITCVVLLGGAAYFGSRLMQPIYQSTTLIQIGFSSGSNQSDYTSLLASDQLVQTETTLATSDPVLREVASHYPGLTADRLSKEVTATPKTNTQLFEIDVQDSSPTRAAALANDITKTLIQLQTQVEQTSFLFQLQAARPASSPTQPSVRLNTILGLVAGLLLAIALSLLFEQLDTSIRSLEALTQLLGWPVLAWISRAKSKEEPIHLSENNLNTEAYRILRTNIGFSAIDKPLRTILVTSATSGEGKSIVAANLAIFMAKAGRNTLLIEADLRRPSLHEQFDYPAQMMGLSNAILEFTVSSSAKASAERPPSTPHASPWPTDAPPVREISLDRFIYSVDVQNLCIMPSGPLPPNPSELLDSKAMERFLTTLNSCGAEMIIFDAPPLLGLSDASILASKVDGTLVVVDTTRAKRGHLQQLKTILEQAGANVLGCVVNKQLRGRDEASYFHYDTAHQQTVGQERSRKKGNSSLDTSGIVKESKAEAQQESSPDITMKFVSVHPAKTDAPSQPDPSDRNLVPLTPVHPAQPDGSMNGSHESAG